ncbi:helix-turn-helix domain-containing protein [Pseudomonas chlororaphis]|uniref:helix-turn-helix domain-containing protein n=1 Tax=Pseudomonas chlororaphis TaxID=587753 RepID=UPI000F586056|nr:helix-turn-helix transcriptional regulator [Pseudomonas chlororaphis]
MELSAAFGQALKQIRKKQGKTQEDFSNVSSRTYLSTLERGLKSPTLEKVQEIAGLLGVQPLTLLAAAYQFKSELPASELLHLVQAELRANGFS